jgi:hypothetical protein
MAERLERFGTQFKHHVVRIAQSNYEFDLYLEIKLSYLT